MTIKEYMFFGLILFCMIKEHEIISSLISNNKKLLEMMRLLLYKNTYQPRKRHKKDTQVHHDKHVN